MARYVPVVLLECHHYTSCLEVYMKFCYHYMCSDTLLYFLSELPSVSLVAQELTAVCEKWLDIGEELGVDQSSPEDIRTEYSDPGDCLWKALRERLRGCSTTWKDIVVVLRTPRIGESHLADHLEAKYCSNELTWFSE